MIFMSPYSGFQKKYKMVERKTIGRVQLVLGIILLVGAVIGGIYSYTLIKDQMESRLGIFGNNPFKDVVFSSNESRLDITMSYLSIVSGTAGSYANIIVTLECSVVIVGLLSVIMVLQGLANIGDKK